MSTTEGQIAKNSNLSILKMGDQGMEAISPTPLSGELLDSLEGNEYVWIDINRFDSLDEVNVVKDLLNLHPLILEDILDSKQLPKFEKHQDFIFLTLKILGLSHESHEIMREHFSILLHDKMVITIHENTSCKILDDLKTRLKENRFQVEHPGCDFMFYIILNAIIENYFKILQKTGALASEMEEKLILRELHNPIQSILLLKKELVYLRKYLYPLREAVGSLLKVPPKHISETTMRYIEDVNDKILHIIEIKADLNDMVASLFDLNMTNNTNKTNEIINLLTLISSVFIPLSFLTGLYGMNFEFMPELKWKWSYPIFLMTVATIATSMLMYMKRKKWF